MFRRIEHLIREARKNTDSEESNAIDDMEILRYFNDGQQNIQSLIYTANGGANIFTKAVIYDLAPNQSVYPVPQDVYAVNSIQNVNIIRDSGYIQPLRLAEYREKDNLYGYSVIRNQIVLTSSFHVSRNLQVLYEAKVPLLSKRIAKVSAFDTVAKTITLDLSTIVESDFQDLVDYVSTCDKKGVISSERLFIDSYDATTGVLTLEGELGQVLDLEGNELLSGVAIDDYLTLGYSATTNSELPLETEPTLLSYVQRRILGKLSSNMVQLESAFTEQEAAAIKDLFEDNSVDPKQPPALDSDYLLY